MRVTAETATRDVRVAIRGLRCRPTFAVAGIGTLALGIGATVAIFSVVDAVLLKALLHPKANRTRWLLLRNAHTLRPDERVFAMLTARDEGSNYMLRS